MKLNELSIEIKLDPNMNNDYEESNEILEQGFNPKYPVIIDQEGWIIDGNHRYEVFSEAGRADEVEFLVINWKTFNNLVDDEIENGTLDSFEDDDEYFYRRVKEVIK